MIVLFFRLCVLSVLSVGLAMLSAPAQARDVADEDSPAWSLQLAAQAGVGMRNVDIPRDGVIYQVRSGAYAVLGVGFQLDYHSSQSFSVGLAARYDSSIGLVLSDQLTGGTVHPRKTRSHHFDVGIAPTWYLGADGWAIQTALGYSVSELDPENHLETPSYHLGGPHARVALRIPLGSERLRLTLGPEGQLTLQVGQELVARGISASGWGAGARAELELALSERWAVALSYRELHYWLHSQQSESFTDGLRFVTAQLRGTL